MKIQKYLRFSFLIVFISVFSLFANDLIPGKKQDKPIALTNAKIFTVSGEIIENGTIIFNDGKITAVGENDLKILQGSEVHDLNGKHVYPGIIAAYSQLGLMEIPAVRATRDYSEAGSYNPNARADIAYNPDSEVTPTVRSNGITTALIAPMSGRISGISSVLNLDAWNREDATILKNAGMILNWPGMTIRTASWIKDSPAKQQENIDKSLKEIDDYFEQAKVYYEARKSNPETKIDIRFESMTDVLDKKMPLIISANEYKQIEAAVNFCKRHNLKMILLSGMDAWKMTGLLKENNIPVILRQTHTLPQREDEDYDIGFKHPALLREAGVKFCIAKTTRVTWALFNLPFYAGTAVAHGLDKADALKAITLWPAEILGVDDKIGSLEVGKNATLIVSSGDLLDMQSNNIEMMFIDGRKVDLDNKHKRLYRKYKARK
ncbi:MAG: amidohydrolase [Calditrichaeota bacterium]|nr:MAG: amidohydrolase [Calditrichota bacterium]MBL1205312.1 amidohydrolase [Calditrichota bacterium]NOG45141.1 amidohydrolase family protein [Calditrichota bacterium]